jgi:hypothetical protein
MVRKLCAWPLQGGTAAAPPYFNDRNRAEPANFWPSAAKCDYVVTLRRKGEDKPGWEGEGQYIDDIGEPSYQGQALAPTTFYCVWLSCVYAGTRVPRHAASMPVWVALSMLGPKSQACLAACATTCLASSK